MDKGQPVWGHRGLIVWQKGIDLLLATYALTKLLPKHEEYNLASQMRSAALSIPSNIAEGRARGSAAGYARFLDHAKGSACELDTQIEVGIQVGYFPRETAQPVIDLITEVVRMLQVMRTKLRAKS